MESNVCFQYQPFKKASFFGFRCRNCRRLPSEHGDVTAAASSSLPSASPSPSPPAGDASGDASPSQQRRALYDALPHKMTPKTKVQPPSFFAPNGEEYLSRDHYVAHVRKQRERELQRRKKEEESLRALKPSSASANQLREHRRVDDGRPSSSAGVSRRRDGALQPLEGRHGSSPAKVTALPTAAPSTPSTHDGGGDDSAAPTSARAAAAATLASEAVHDAAARTSRSRLSNVDDGDGNDGQRSARSIERRTPRSGGGGASGSGAIHTTVTVRPSFMSSSFSTPLQRKAPCFAFPRADRAAAAPPPGPAPDAYNASAAVPHVRPKSPAYTLRPKTSAGLSSVVNATPAPGAYKIRSFVEESKLKKKGKTISFRTKTEEERAIALGYDTGPGPACVALPSFTELPYGKSKSMALRLQSNEIGVSWVPGPGAPLRSFVEEDAAARRGAFITGRLSDPLAPRDPGATPGPGSFELPSFVQQSYSANRGAFLMSRGPPLGMPDPDIPGPGAYDIRPRAWEHVVHVGEVSKAKPSPRRK